MRLGIRFLTVRSRPARFVAMRVVAFTCALASVSAVALPGTAAASEPPYVVNAVGHLQSTCAANTVILFSVRGSGETYSSTGGNAADRLNAEWAPAAAKVLGDKAFAV